MTKKGLLFVTAVCVATFCAPPSFAQSAGVATTYQIQIQKVELCTGNGGGNGCDNPYVVGSAASTFDIAAAAAGAQVGSYASSLTPPAGTTYTHMRVTLSRFFTIAGAVSSVAGAGGTGNCRTGGADATGYTLATAGPGLNTAGSATAQVLSIANEGEWGGGEPSYPSSFNVVDDAAAFTITYALSQSFTVSALNPPTINIAFDTQTALGAFGTSPGCVMFPQEPSVTVSIQ